MIDVAVPMQRHGGEHDLKWYLELLWFRQINDSNTKYYLIPSVCILDIIDAITRRHKILMDAKQQQQEEEEEEEKKKKTMMECMPAAKRRKLNHEFEVPDPEPYEFEVLDEETMHTPMLGMDDDTDIKKNHEDVEIPAREVQSVPNGMETKLQPPPCICGHPLTEMSTKTAAELMDVDEFLCDKCDEKIVGELIFHCNNPNNDMHRDGGYDLCVLCAKKASASPIKTVTSISISVPQIFSGGDDMMMMMPNLESFCT